MEGGGRDGNDRYFRGVRGYIVRNQVSRREEYKMEYLSCIYDVPVWKCTASSTGSISLMFCNPTSE